ncbi:MAG TPA: 4'-phosphopantetheinyl transferase [Cyanobacteria bacterium UBA8553]|nr:4'-phosphopantetheinyl transferase [Cyanobacteria bacterium UBA8553]HAJ59172.1 4'-phosphopantetheinyl transferase [Cyanobacteria bacterium UBA8543]
MAPKNLWHSPPKNLVLLKDYVHVWRADLNLPAWRLQQLAQTLCSDEQHRAERFYFEQDKKYFTAGRGLLRTILGRYLDLDPKQLQFSYSSRGKPALVNTNSKEALCFNLSHSNGLALYAVTRSRSIGIDLEHMRPMPDAEKLAQRFFSPQEYTVISTLLPEHKQEAFFNAWTRKEAYLKATGDGLAGLEQVEVSLIPGETAALLRIQGDRQAASRWSIYQLTPAPNYVAALAVEGHDWNLECFDISENY